MPLLKIMDVCQKSDYNFYLAKLCQKNIISYLLKIGNQSSLFISWINNAILTKIIYAYENISQRILRKLLIIESCHLLLKKKLLPYKT